MGCCWIVTANLFIKYDVRLITFIYAFIGLGYFVLSAAPVWAGMADMPWEVKADKMSRFTNPECLVAEGHVVMTRKQGTLSGVTPVLTTTGPKPLTIHGDWLRLEKGNLIKVRGHVVLDSAAEHITAEMANLDLRNHTGTLRHATLYFPKRHVYLVGEEVTKTGELTYYLRDGWITKCAPEAGKAPPWSFGWSRAHITEEGFAHFVNATLRVKNVPVLYSPYFAFSTNQHRKTGLLMPEFSQGSRDGSGVLVPFFINLSPSQDVTLYGGDLSKRGGMGGVEYRYVHDKNSKGMVALNYLHDKLKDTAADDYKSDGIYRTIKNRYWLRGKIDHAFPDGWLGRADIDLVSDRDYLQEYSDGLLGFTKSDQRFNKAFKRGFESKTTLIRSNTLQLSKSWTNMSLNGELRTVDDTTSTPSTHHLWSLPHITFDGRTPLLRYQAGAGAWRSFAEATDILWNTDFIYYWQEAGVGGQRLDLHPQLSAPLSISPYLETTATLGARETFYNVEDKSGGPARYGSGILNRYLYDFNLATSTIFMRDFSLTGQRHLTHMIRPRISYDYIPYRDQSYLPSMDGKDRIAAKNLITYGLDNDFDLGRQGDDNQGRRLAYSKISQSYNIREAHRDLSGPDDHHRPLSNIAIEAGLYPLPAWSMIYKTQWNVYGRGILNYELTSNYSNDNKDSVGFGYRYYPAQTVNQININLTKNFTHVLMAQAIFDHSLSTDETSDASLRLFYNPACWSMEILAATATDEDYRFTVLFSLEGVGNIIGFNKAMK